MGAENETALVAMLDLRANRLPTLALDNGDARA
jgi:hypothetical protein